MGLNKPEKPTALFKPDLYPEIPGDKTQSLINKASSEFFFALQKKEEAQGESSSKVKPNHKRDIDNISENSDDNETIASNIWPSGID
jgi:hypothetical protein